MSMTLSVLQAINLTHWMQCLMYCRCADVCWSISGENMLKQHAGLSVVVQNIMQAKPFTRSLYLFCNKKRNLAFPYTYLWESFGLFLFCRVLVLILHRLNLFIHDRLILFSIPPGGGQISISSVMLFLLVCHRAASTWWETTSQKKNRSRLKFEAFNHFRCCCFTILPSLRTSIKAITIK